MYDIYNYIYIYIFISLPANPDTYYTNIICITYTNPDRLVYQLTATTGMMVTFPNGQPNKFPLLVCLFVQSIPIARI